MNELYLCESKQIDLKSTLDGGQAFRWHQHGNGFRGVIGQYSYYIFARNKKIYISSDNLIKEKIVFIKNIPLVFVELRNVYAPKIGPPQSCPTKYIFFNSK